MITVKAMLFCNKFAVSFAYGSKCVNFSKITSFVYYGELNSCSPISNKSALDTISNYKIYYLVAEKVE